MKIVIDPSKMLDALGAIKATRNDEVLLELKDDRWMMKSQDEAGTLMAAVLASDGVMEEYSKGDYEEIGININKPKSFIRSSGGDVTLEMEDRALHMYQGGTHARIGTINPGDVAGKMRTAPNLNYPVHIKAESGILHNFINRQEEVVGSGNYYIGARKDGVYLYSTGDNGDLDRHIRWEEVEDKDIKWSRYQTPKDDVSDKANHPDSDQALDVIMSTEITKDIKKPADTCWMYFTNQGPMRILYDMSEEDSDGLKISFMQAPRIDNKGRPTIPDSVTN